MKLGNYEQVMGEYRARCLESEEKVKVLEQHLQETKKAREEVLKEVREKCEEFDELNKLLNEAKQCVLEALQVREYVRYREYFFLDGTRVKSGSFEEKPSHIELGFFLVTVTIFIGTDCKLLGCKGYIIEYKCLNA